MELFWEIHQQTAVRQARQSADQARRSAESARQRIEYLEGKCDKALLVCEALWTLLKEQNGFTDEQLLARINEIDLSDGKLDGKVKKQAVNCKHCNRLISQRFSRCMWCGRESTRSPFA